MQLSAGDAATIDDGSQVVLSDAERAEVLLFDLPV